MDGIFRDVVAKLAGLPPGRARLHATAGHPEREAPRMVVAAEVGPRPVEPLAVVCATELAPPDHKRVVEHAAVGEILHEGRRRLVSLLRFARDAPLQAAVVVPVLVVELDKPHAPLGQPAGEQAVGREAARVAGLGTVGIKHMGRLVGEVGHRRHARLHPEGHLVIRDPGRDHGVGRAGELVLVERSQAVEHLAAAFGRHAGRIVDIEHRVGPGAEPHSLVLCRQEARSPEVAHEGLALLVLCDQNDERRQVVLDVAQAVVEPGPDARPAWDLRATLHEGHARPVVDALGMHRVDKAEPVGNLCRVGQEV